MRNGPVGCQLSNRAVSAQRDLTAAHIFLRRALATAHHSRPRVINVDGHPAYPSAVRDLQRLRRPTPSKKKLRFQMIANTYSRPGRVLLQSKARITIAPMRS
jgi:transposase-like protein